MPAVEFVRELEKLRAFRQTHAGLGLLESLEKTGLLLPRIRIRYPDPVARRFWLETHERQLKFAIEPDGSRWESAVELSNRLYRWRNHTAYGVSPHPLDDPEPRFVEFVQRPSGESFQPWQDIVETVYGNDPHSTELLADANRLREALVQAARTTHPGHREDIEGVIPSCVEFLAPFGKVFTLNYDLLLYWVILQRGANFSDGFGLGVEANGFLGPFKTEAYCTIFNVRIPMKADSCSD
jgi:hypothetical protein